MAGHLQADRHVDQRPPVWHREKPAQAGRVVKSVVAVVIDPGRYPARTKSVKPKVYLRSVSLECLLDKPHGWVGLSRAGISWN